ncbi:MAG: hypothetical protein ACLQNE_44820 [Thermoguttaceae bacterium]
MEYRNQAAKHHRSQPGNQPDQDRQKVDSQKPNRLSVSRAAGNHRAVT